MPAFLFALFGMIGSILICGMWKGAALLFGFPPPTADQFNGLFGLLACGGFIAGAVGSALFN